MNLQLHKDFKLVCEQMQSALKIQERMLQSNCNILGDKQSLDNRLETIKVSKMNVY